MEVGEDGGALPLPLPSSQSTEGVGRRVPRRSEPSRLPVMNMLTASAWASTASSVTAAVAATPLAGRPVRWSR